MHTHGDGYSHIAVYVDHLDLEPTVITEFQRDGSLMARFFFVQDPDGYKLEVLERHGRYQ